MMLRLVVNDFRLNAIFAFWVFLLFNVQLVLMAWLGGPGKYLLSGLQSGIAFASAMVVAVFLREEQNRGKIINRSLPISHAKAVYARYLSVALYVIANMLYGVFYQRVVGLPEWISRMDLYFLFRLNDSLFVTEHSLIAWALAVTLTICIAVPLCARYGTFWRILIGYVVLIIGWPTIIACLVRCSVSATVLFGSVGGWILVAVVFMIAILAASIRLSTWLYGRKDL
jgi:hypothetical protein